MNQLRLDPLSGRWVVVSPGRSERPYSFVTRSPWLPDTLGRPCPFCPGNEEDTPPALETYGPTGGWLVRVVPNAYPAFEGDEPFVVAQNGGAAVAGERKAANLDRVPLRARLGFGEAHAADTGLRVGAAGNAVAVDGNGGLARHVGDGDHALAQPLSNHRRLEGSFDNALGRFGHEPTPGEAKGR